jgi:hypothetical protein
MKYPVSYRGEFQPKEGGPLHTVSLTSAEGTGYDLSLFIDTTPPTDDSGFMLEFGIDADGSFSGQVTARPGSDALALLRCSQTELRVDDMHPGGPVCVIREGQPQPSRDDALRAALRGALAEVKTINDTLNDPHGDGSGDGSQPPDGDSYNAVLDAIAPLWGLIGNPEI